MKGGSRVETSIQIEVRPTEIDVMGHVNNAKYMEWSREDWYNKANLPFDTFTEMNIGTVTVHIAINYRKEARLGEKLTISTKPLRKGRTSYVLEHVITNEQGERVADAEVVSCTIDLTARKSVPIPETLARQFEG
jgi:thioesterase III